MKVNVPEVIKKPASKVAQVTEANAPGIMIFAGVGLGITAVVLAARATFKATKEEKFTEIKEDIYTIRDAKARLSTKDAEFTAKDFAMDASKAVGRLALKVGKIYGPTVAVAAGSVACVLGGYSVLDKRYMSAVATAASFKTAYDEYRAHVIEKYGEKVDDEFRGIKTTTVETPVLDKNGIVKTDKNGVVKVTKESLCIIDPRDIKEYSPYAFVWSRLNEDGTENLQWDSCFDLNWEAGMTEERLANAEYKSSFKGYFEYNKIRDAFDIPLSKYMNAGWFNSKDNPNTDGYIDFRMRKVMVTRDDGESYEEAILFDPNVDGDISQFFEKNNVYKRMH